MNGIFKFANDHPGLATFVAVIAVVAVDNIAANVCRTVVARKAVNRSTIEDDEPKAEMDQSET